MLCSWQEATEGNFTWAGAGGIDQMLINPNEGEAMRRGSRGIPPRTWGGGGVPPCSAAKDLYTHSKHYIIRPRPRPVATGGEGGSAPPPGKI